MSKHTRNSYSINFLHAKTKKTRRSGRERVQGSEFRRGQNYPYRMVDPCHSTLIPALRAAIHRLNGGAHSLDGIRTGRGDRQRGNPKWSRNNRSLISIHGEALLYEGAFTHAATTSVARKKRAPSIYDACKADRAYTITRTDELLYFLRVHARLSAPRTACAVIFWLSILIAHTFSRVLLLLTLEYCLYVMQYYSYVRWLVTYLYTFMHVFNICLLILKPRGYNWL